MSGERIGAAGQAAGDLHGVGHADDLGALPRLVHAQRDPEVRVRADLRADDSAGPLRREDQVHAEAAASPRDVDDALDEFGELLGEAGELVDHDDEARRRDVGIAALQLGKVGRAGVAQQRFAAPQLRPQRSERTLGQMLVEVGDEPDLVRQLDALLKGQAALVVDEEIGEPGGRIGDGERRDQRLEELALAGAGDARDEGVRAISPQVDAERPFGSGSQGRSQPGWRRAPAVGDAFRGQIGREQVRRSRCCRECRRRPRWPSCLAAAQARAPIRRRARARCRRRAPRRPCASRE